MLVQAGFKQGRSRIQASYQAEGIGERGLPKAIIVGASSWRTAYQSDWMSLPHLTQNQSLSSLCRCVILTHSISERQDVAPTSHSKSIPVQPM